MSPAKTKTKVKAKDQRDDAHHMHKDNSSMIRLTAQLMQQNRPQLMVNIALVFIYEVAHPNDGFRLLGFLPDVLVLAVYPSKQPAPVFDQGAAVKTDVIDRFSSNTVTSIIVLISTLLRDRGDAVLVVCLCVCLIFISIAFSAILALRFVLVLIVIEHIFI